MRHALHVLLMAAFFGAYGKKAAAQPTVAAPGVARADAGFRVFSDSFPVMFGRRRIPLAETTAIISLMPLLITAITMLSAPLLRESAEKIQWAAALGFAGVLLIIRPGASVSDPAVFSSCRA